MLTFASRNHEEPSLLYCNIFILIRINSYSEITDLNF